MLRLQVLIKCGSKAYRCLQGAKPLRPALKSGSATMPAQVPRPPGPHRRVVLRFPKVLSG